MIPYRMPSANELQQLLAQLDLPPLKEAGDIGSTMNEFARALPYGLSLAWDDEAGEHVVVARGGVIRARATRSTT